MKNLAILARALQLFAHNAHNLCSGPTFHEDHEFFGGLYGKYDGIYDLLVEKMIGIGETPDLLEINKTAAGAVAGFTTNQGAYQVLFATETAFQTNIRKEYAKASIGVQNLLAQLYDDSENRQYKIKQRIK